LIKNTCKLHTSTLIRLTSRGQEIKVWGNGL